MSEKVYCYHCRSYHTSEQVRLVQTKNGKRWRCKQSLQASRSNTEARDAFGESVRRQNQLIACQQDAISVPHSVLEALRTNGGRNELSA